MTEAEWLVSNHPLPMVVHVLDNVSHNKLARLVVALYRINGKVNECNEVESLIDTSTQKSLLWGDCRSLAVGCAWACTDGRDNGKAGAEAVRDIIGNPFRKVESWYRERTYYPADDTAPVTERYPASPWLTPTVLSLAQAAYNIRCRGCNQCYDGWLPGECIRPCPNTTDGTLDPARLAVLADALEEAGCNNGYILRHLRGWEPCRWCFGGSHGSEQACGGYDYRKHEWGFHGWMKCSSHYRGCWAVDLILGKE